MTFSDADTQKLLQIMKARRDVRGNRFINTPIEEVFECLHLKMSF